MTGVDEKGSEPVANDAPGPDPPDRPPATAEVESKPDGDPPRERTRRRIALLGVVLFFVVADLALFRGALSTEPERRATISYPMRDGARWVDAEHWPEILLQHARDLTLHVRG